MKNWIWLIVVGFLVAALVVVLLMPKGGKTELIGSGPAQEFELVEAPVGEYGDLTVILTADHVSEAIAPTVVWSGVIPKDAQFYNVTLADGSKAYSLLLTIREDGIGCMPTDYPYALTLQIYGRK